MSYRITTLTHASATILALVFGNATAAAQEASAPEPAKQAAEQAAAEDTIRLNAITLIGTGLPRAHLRAPARKRRPA